MKNYQVLKKLERWLVGKIKLKISWAIKESLVKAGDCKTLRFSGIRVKKSETGAPKIYFNKENIKKLAIDDNTQISVSISHEEEYLVAFSIIFSF